MAGVGPDVVGKLYLIHLDEPLGDDGNGGRSRLQHYSGFALRSVANRVKSHRRKKPDDGTDGAECLGHANVRGIGWQVVAIEPGTKREERRRKLAGHHERRCPVCTPAKRKENDMPDAHVHTGPGAAGIRSETVYCFTCGGCGASHEERARNVTAARGRALTVGWVNGRRREPVLIGWLPSGEPETIESSWRCPSCAGTGAPTPEVRITAENAAGEQLAEVAEHVGGFVQFPVIPDHDTAQWWREWNEYHSPGAVEGEPVPLPEEPSS